MRDQYSLDDSPENIRLQQAWQNALKRLSPDVPPQWFDRFLKPLRPVNLEGTQVRIAVPGRFVMEWVRERYLMVLQSYLGDELGIPVMIELQLELREKTAPEEKRATLSAQTAVRDEAGFTPNDKFSFESFIVGQSNRLAFAGAKSVSTEPGKKYNPLFIYGVSGVGKTHLLHAIAREIQLRNPSYPMVYITAQQFAENFVQALQNNRIDAFRRQQRNVSLWLVDDIQLIAGKDKTSEEIFHTFNYLQGLGKQIVLSSDRPPRDLYLMDERLRSRFESGLVADIQMPDTETRCAILMSKANQETIPLSVEIAMHLAENVPGNIRRLVGAMTKLAVACSVDHSAITMDHAKELIEKYYKPEIAPKPGFKEIVDAVGRHYKISSDDIQGISRKAPIVHARHVAIYVTRELTRDSWKHIGTLFGDRDHTSMMHGYQKVNEMMLRDKDFKAAVKMLINTLYREF